MTSLTKLVTVKMQQVTLPADLPVTKVSYVVSKRALLPEFTGKRQRQAHV